MPKEVPGHDHLRRTEHRHHRGLRRVHVFGALAAMAAVRPPRRAEGRGVPRQDPAHGRHGLAAGLLPARDAVYRRRGVGAAGHRRRRDGGAALVAAQHAAEHRRRHRVLHAARAARLLMPNRASRLGRPVFGCTFPAYPL